MEVINFDEDCFKSFYKRIYDEISFFDEILVIGVASAGVPIQEGLADYLLSCDIKVEQATIKCSRPSTNIKKSNSFMSRTIKFFLSILPIFFLDMLRVLEHKFLSRRQLMNNRRELSWIKSPVKDNYNLVIIVDDAVDSGHSIKIVLDSVNTLLNYEAILTAVIVETQKNPIFSPDVSMYKNVLIRFPWSLDAKK